MTMEAEVARHDGHRPLDPNIGNSEKTGKPQDCCISAMNYDG
jgi:hypothetical protein